MATAATSAAAVRPSGAASAAGVCPDCRLTPPDLIHDFATGSLICAHCNASVGHRLATPSAKWPAATAESTSSSSASEPPSPVLALAQRSRSRASVQRQERSLQRALNEITQYSRQLDLPPSTLPLALSLYRQAEAANLHRGKNPMALSAACLFLACRQLGVARTFKEICHHTRVPRKDIGRTFKFLKDRLQQQEAPLAGCMSVSSDDLIGRFCQRLSLLGGAMECAGRVNRVVRARDTLAGKSPVSVAAACIYLAAHLVGQPRLPSTVSCVAGVSEVTIRNAYRLLYVDREALVGTEVLEADPMADIDNLPTP